MKKIKVEIPVSLVREFIDKAKDAPFGNRAAFDALVKSVEKNPEAYEKYFEEDKSK